MEQVKLKKKLNSITMVMGIVATLLIPLSWVIEYVLKMHMLNYMVENNLQPTELQFMFISIPLQPIVTFATVVLSLVIGRRMGREISTNLSLPVGQNAVTQSQVSMGSMNNQPLQGK
jgi:hypothetical protein